VLSSATNRSDISASAPARPDNQVLEGRAKKRSLLPASPVAKPPGWERAQGLLGVRLFLQRVVKHTKNQMSQGLG